MPLNQTRPASIATKDHVAARSKGNKHKINNVVIACGACNLAKADGDVVQFMKCISQAGAPKLRRRGDLPKWYKLSGYYPPAHDAYCCAA